MNPLTSIDPEEIAFYERLAALWWDREGPFWPLHRMNDLRVNYIREAVTQNFGRDPVAAEPLAGLRVVDIGCGGGILSEAVSRLGAHVHGIDVVAKNICIARQHAEQSALKIHYETASAEVLAGRGEQYDVILNMEVVEHIAELPFFLDACMRLVKPGGLMVIATINRTLASWLGAIVMAEYVLRWLPKGTHRWKRFRTPVELENLLVAGGFSVVARSGVVVNPFGMSFRLSSYMDINYILVARKPPK